MMSMNAVSTIALCLGTALIITLIIVARMSLKETKERREFRRRGLS
jgi:hypothetical protein